MLDTIALRDLYRKRARRYDLTASLFSLAGAPLPRYRRRAIAALGVGRGDTVIDLACGTGLNFPFIEEAIGPEGRLIGVDLTDAMLEQARRRVAHAGWTNVELVQADVSAYVFPPGTAGIVSTLGITLIPEYDTIIGRAATALRSGGRFVVFDMKRPAGWPLWLVKLVAWVNRPFGVTLDLAARHPWESVRRYLREVEFREFYAGALYLSAGERPFV